MEFKTQARYALETSRWFTERILENFTEDDHWFYQVHPRANHALWIVAHLGLADNMFASRFREDQASKPEGWDELFWFGSELKDDRSAYPSADDVLAYFRERREVLLDVLDNVTYEELSAEGPPKDAPSPIAGAPSIGHLFLFCARHESIHAGQLTVAHRGLGNAPMFAPKSEA